MIKAGLVQLRAMAAAGATRSECAAEMEVSYHTIVVTAQKHGIAFIHASAGDSNVERSRAMAALYGAGYTLQEIGNQYSLTRERVRQIITKRHGMTAISGGAYAKADVAKKRRIAKREARCLSEKGCTLAQLAHLHDLGLKMREAGASFSRTPTGAYASQRRNAFVRGIEWSFTLWQWWTVWDLSGKWDQRGTGQGYVMCRKGDTGPYSVDNVFIAPAIENSSLTKAKKSGMPIGVQKIVKGKYIAFVAKRRLNGHTSHLGSFKTPELAHAAYLMAGAA